MPGPPVQPDVPPGILSAFVRQMPVAVAMFDRDMRYLQASDRWCADYGLDPGNVIGRSQYDLFDIPPRWKEAHRRGLAGETVAKERDYFEVHGHPIWMRWEVRPWGSREGMPEGILIFAEDITERVLAENRVRNSDAQLRAALEAMNGAVLISDKEGSCIACNRAFISYHKFSGSENCAGILAKYTDLVDVFLPGGARALPGEWAVSRALDGETAVDQEYALQRKDTGEKWYGSYSFAPIRDDSGAILGSVVVAHDVTRQKMEQTQLAVCHRQFLDLVANSPDGIARLDLEGRYTFVNPRMAEFAGRRPEDFIGKPIGTVSVGAPEYWLAKVRKVVSSKRMERADFFSPADVVQLNVRFVPELDAAGEVESILLIATDISALRQAETQAAERQSLIAALFDAAAQAVFAVDAEGKILLVNQIVAREFGYQMEELIGQPHEILLPEQLRERHAAHVRTYVANPTRRAMGQGMDLVARRKDGSLFPVEVSLSYFQSSRGLLTVAVVTNISLRKQQEQELLESASEIRKLGASLLTAEEDAARALARELHDDVTQRLALLSIEMGKAVNDVPGRPIAATLRGFQSRILEISEDIRRISHHMHPAILDDLGLTAAIESLCEELGRQLSLPIHFQSRDIPAGLDRNLATCLYRVCQECLRNVGKHAGAGEVFVSLSLADGWLQLSVVDTGNGFHPHSRHRGLGMRSMQERVRFVGGTLSISSTPGHGTEVLVRVPAKGAALDAPPLG